MPVSVIEPLISRTMVIMSISDQNRWGSRKAEAAH